MRTFNYENSEHDSRTKKNAHTQPNTIRKSHLPRIALLGVYSSISSDKCRMRHLSILVQFSFHSRFKQAQSCQKKSNLHTNSLNKLLFAWYSRMENICSVRQQLFEICRIRHELIEIEEYTPWSAILGK
jgi:hypothetical protein